MFGFFKKKNNTDETPINGPDYSMIDSNEKAIDLYKKGELVKLYLMPLEFGGEDSPVNTLYVPEFAQEFKQRFDVMVEELLREGKELAYSAEPAYKGSSFIPSALTIKVTGESEFTEVIQVW
ncbi:hypothetical protein U8527_05100 [Kordia algicida OT-1]|uniref:Uncharacterized protein n=1 Tax=Kordia algicida OT-1 TaxID=391587 RepID=A9DMG2_9FLAO|nr:hypothetical protein [Kordia algicida]EDP97698.1 hypothetical protein KAOT1_21087 [Kordia algicida OT-1]